MAEIHSRPVTPLRNRVVQVDVDSKRGSFWRRDLQECGVGQSESRERGGSGAFHAGNDDFLAVLDENPERLAEPGAFRLLMLREQIGRFGQRIWGDTNGTDCGGFGGSVRCNGASNLLDEAFVV